MKQTDIFILASKIAYFYKLNQPHTAMNAAIARALTNDQYRQFCELAASRETQKKATEHRILFKIEYLNNRVNIEDEARDSDVCELYELDKLFEILSKVE
jgi:hypothetical protein